MKIAVLGGSFNPVHVGHLILADCLCREKGYDKVLFVPTSIPPHKQMAVETSGNDRLEMLRLATECDERFEVEPCELERQGISYTYDTICYLEKKYGSVLEGKIGLVFGMDLVADYNKWYKAQELSEKTDLIIACRPQDPVQDMEHKNLPTGEFGKGKNLLTLENFPYVHSLIENPEVLISSSQIRRRLAEGKGCSYLVTPKVFDYILKRGLYGTAV